MIPARSILMVVLAVALLTACSGPEIARVEGIPATASPTDTVLDPQVTLVPTHAIVTATTFPSPSPTTIASPTQVPPTLPPTETPLPVASPSPTAIPTSIPAPTGQIVGLPDIDAHYRLIVDELRLTDGFVNVGEVITIREFRGEVPDRIFLQVVPAEYGFFTLRSLTLDDAEIVPGTLNDGFTLVVNLPAGSAAPLEIGIDFSLWVGADPTGWAGTMLDSGILRLGYWFPVISNDHGYSDIFDPSYTATAEFDVSVTLDASHAVAHTGEIIGQLELDDGRVRRDLHASDVRDFALVVSRGFTVDEATTSTGVRIELFTTSAAIGTRQNILFWAADAIEQLTELIGPYPYPTFRIVDVGPSIPGGLEFPGLVYINPAYSSLERLIYHEVAHQWLYGIIGTRALDDGWIDEGGAEFLERGLPTGFTEVPEIPAGGYRYPLDSSYQELDGASWADAYYSIYEQGARLYYAVLEAMGWNDFWTAMQGLYENHRFGIVTAWDVLSQWQSHSQTDLRPLYHEYFRYEWIDRLPGPAG
jgi:hypothetical protein